MSYDDAAYIAHALSVGEALITADQGGADHAVAQHVTTYLLPDDLPKLERAYPSMPSS